MLIATSTLVALGIVATIVLGVRNRKEPVASALWFVPLIVTNAAGFGLAAVVLWTMSASGTPREVVDGALDPLGLSLRVMQIGLVGNVLVGMATTYLVLRKDDEPTFPKKTTALTAVILFAGLAVPFTSEWSIEAPELLLLQAVSIPVFFGLHVGACRLLSVNPNATRSLTGIVPVAIALASWVAFTSLFAVEQMWGLRVASLDHPNAVSPGEYWEHMILVLLPFMISAAVTSVVMRFNSVRQPDDKPNVTRVLGVSGIILIALALPPFLARTAYKPVSQSVRDAIETLSVDDDSASGEVDKARSSTE